MKIILFSRSDSLRELSVIKRAFYLGNHNFFINTGEIFNGLKWVSQTHCPNSSYGNNPQCFKWRGSSERAVALAHTTIALPWPLPQVYLAPKASWRSLSSGTCKPCREGSHAAGLLGQCPPRGPEGSPCTPCDLWRQSCHWIAAEQNTPRYTKSCEKAKPIYLYW